MIPRNKITVLPEGLANRIAAGEVVERPASVVKELIENSLDAEARSITISVKKSGQEEILVSDDGWGMDEEDINLAFRRHATSKIKEAKDLQCILHLGFRGEALPSIGSVSRVEVVSRREDRDSGILYRVDGGVEKEIEPAPRERGTTIKIRSLFYNVPARRKFLKTPATEYGRIVQVFKRYVLAYPEKDWELIRDDKRVWKFEAGELKDRIRELFGEDAANDLHEVESRSGDVFVNGVIGGSSLFKRTRRDQYLYVNKRPFQSNSLHHAVVNGFGPLIEYGQIPFYVLNLRLDPEEFDVNVHPAKHEIRFKDDGLTYRAILVAVRDALGLALRSGDAPVRMPLAEKNKDNRQSSIDGIKELELVFGRPENQQPQNTVDQVPVSIPEDAPLVIPEPPMPGQKLYTIGKKDHESSESLSKMAGPETGSAFSHDATAPASSGESAQRVNVWQVHRTYILSQTKSGLVIIDQHVAHERILFEKALAAMKERPWNGQRLLFPTSVSLDPADSALLEELVPGLSKMGFEVEPFGGNDWVIRSIPAGVKVKNEEKLLNEVIADYRQEHEIRMQPEESLAASFACKAAIKAGDPLNLEEMNALIDELFTTEYPFVCPHGRPVVVNLTLSELHKLFGRE